MGKKLDTVTILRNVGIFAAADSDALAMLQDKLVGRTYKPGTDLCRQGEAGDRMFIIESGEVAVLKHTDADDPVEITRLRDGDVAGEMSLLGNIRRSATLRVVEEAQIWELGAQDFQQQVEHNPALARALLSNLTKHLHRETSVVAQLMSRGLDRRFRVAFFDSKPYIRQAFDEALEQGEYALNIHHLEPRLSPETVSLAAGSDAVCVFVNDNVNEEVVEELAALDIKLIALRCAGYNNVDLAACAQHGVSVVRVPAYSPYAVAEHAVAMMMTLNRRTHRANGRVREGNFSLDGLVGFDVHGKTVGVVGTGKIGCCFTQIMAGFGCRLLGYDKFPNQDLAARTGLEYVPLEVLLAQSDIISLHAPLLPETHYLVDEQAIAAMKDGVMLLNTSRGGLIKTSALLDGLKSRKVGYAGLDVYEEESAYFFEDFSSDVLTDDVLARLTTFNNVLVTSHQAFLTHDALIGIAGTTCANIREFADGKRGEALQNHVALPAVREDAQPVGASG